MLPIEKRSVEYAISGPYDRWGWYERAGAIIELGTTVLALKMEGDRMVGLSTTPGDRTAGTVICAAGVWSSRLLNHANRLLFEDVLSWRAQFDTGHRLKKPRFRNWTRSRA
jgi:phytoene dehydrogenase-like protein